MSDSGPEPDAFDDLDALPDGTYTVVVDAIEDGLARAFVEQDGEEITSVLLDPAVLPADGRHADAIFELTITDGTTTTLEYDPETTASRKEAAQDRFDRLSKRPPWSHDSETSGSDSETDTHPSTKSTGDPDT